MRRIVGILTLVVGLMAPSCAGFAAFAAGPAATAAILGASTPTTAAEAAMAAEDSAGRLRSGTVDLSSGVRMHYVERGAGAASPGTRADEVVIFLHGFTDSSHSFRSLMDRLDPAIRAIAIDQRGHGDSSRPACCYAPDDFARDVVAFMDARQIAAATIVGHSMGGVVAQLVAAMHPNRVDSLVLIGTAATLTNPAVDDLLSVVKTLNDPIDRRFVTEFQAGTVFSPLPPGELDGYVDESLQVAPRVWIETLTALATIDTRPALARIGARTLILWGDKDGICSRGDQLTLAHGIRHARLQVYEDVGHSLHWEAPGRVAADIEAFLRGAALLTRR